MVAVAQLAERRPVESNVAGSSPVSHPLMIKERDCGSGNDIKEEATDAGEVVLLALNWLDEQIGNLERNYKKNSRGESFVESDLEELRTIKERADNGDYGPLTEELKKVAKIFMLDGTGQIDKGSRLYSLGCEYLRWAKEIESEEISGALNEED